MRVIFVCSGNICRSPMAEGLFRDQLTKRGIRGAAISMGTLDLVGRAAAENAIIAMEKRGVDINHHRSQGISAGILRAADRVFVMERAHIAALEKRSPGLGAKAELLGRLDGGPDEIDDPVGQDLATFEACADRLVACIDAIFAEGRV